MAVILLPERRGERESPTANHTQLLENRLGHVRVSDPPEPSRRGSQASRLAFSRYCRQSNSKNKIQLSFNAIGVVHFRSCATPTREDDRAFGQGMRRFRRRRNPQRLLSSASLLNRIVGYRDLHNAQTQKIQMQLNG